MKKIKKYLYFTLFLLGILAILLVIATKQIVSGFQLRETEILLEFSHLFKLDVELIKEMNLVILLIKINNYSHFIITACIMFAVTFLFLWNAERKRGVNNERQ
jgi:hypothetical protein